jgi:hypothetical protein
MSDFRSGRFEQEPRERSSSLADTIENAIRRISTAIVIAGGLVAVGIFASSGDGDEAPRYQVAAAQGRIYRLDTENGTVIGCEGERCAIVLRRGQHLEDELSEEAEEAAERERPGQTDPSQIPPPTLRPAPAPAASPAAPAPAQSPAAPAEPQPDRR